jgi:hypothetical protein
VAAALLLVWTVGPAAGRRAGSTLIIAQPSYVIDYRPPLDPATLNILAPVELGEGLRMLSTIINVGSEPKYLGLDCRCQSVSSTMVNSG